LNDLARSRRFSVAAHDRVWHVHWRGLARGAVREHATHVIVRSSAFQGCLTVPATTANAALTPYLGTLTWDDLPERMQLAILQDCADHAAGEEDARLAGPVLVKWPVGAGDTQPVVELALTVDGMSAPVLLYWTPSRGTVPESQVHLEGWEQLAIPVRGELGWVDLSLTELSGLEPGDVVLPDSWWGTKDLPRAAVHAGNRIFMATVDAESRFAEVESFKEINVDQIIEASTVSDGLDADLGQVPVRVTFDLGEQVISLEELATIAPGYVFDLGGRPQDAVVVRANGQRVGEGELVEIEGRLGVAITRIAGPRGRIPS
jgi:type III secretion protein Q